MTTAKEQTHPSDLEFYQKKRVKEIMTVSPVTIQTSTPLKTALAILEKNNFHHLPIVNEDYECTGILSDRDLINARNIYSSNSEAPGGLEFQTWEVMTTELITISPLDPISHAAEIMVKERFNALPVVENKKLVGILTSTDLVRLFVRNRIKEDDFGNDLKSIFDAIKEDGHFYAQSLYLKDEIEEYEKQFEYKFPEDYKLTVTAGSYEMANFNFVKPYRDSGNDSMLVFAEWNQVHFAFNAAMPDDSTIFTLAPQLSPEKSDFKTFTEWFGHVYKMSSRPVNPE